MLLEIHLDYNEISQMNQFETKRSSNTYRKPVPPSFDVSSTGLALGFVSVIVALHHKKVVGKKEC